MRRGLLSLIMVIFMITGVAHGEYLVEGKDYVDNKIVVNLMPSVGNLQIDKSSGIPQCGIEEVDKLNRDYLAFDMYRLFPTNNDEKLRYYYVIRFDDAPELDWLLTRYDALSSVEHVEPVSIEKLFAIPNDPRYDDQWHLPKVEAPAAWDIEKGDEDVIIAIPDTGVDWDHPDLQEHMWINEAEDYNGNGVFDNFPVNEGGDLDGVDNDNNGYVDDVTGWDWVHTNSWFCTDADCRNADNDPMDYVGHGTHCSGIASAVTNNGVGVAGLDWNGTVMPLRIGYQYLFILGVVEMDWAASSIVYATDKGARVVSCSWGSANTGGLGAAVDYAVANNVLIFSAAGNDNNQQQSYLCSRADVLAVAATDQNDHKASFSNYGAWIDVSAPGVSILSTVFNDGYTRFDGTSMASPLAAGLAGLVFSQNPQMTGEEVGIRIMDTCDDIDDINPNYAGLLGAGRINAYAALEGGGPSQDLTVSMVPDDPPITVPPGGSFTYTGIVSNEGDSPVVTDIWVMLDIPGYGMYGPVQQANNVSLNANQTISYSGITQQVPNYAPTGLYYNIAYVGDYPGSPVDSAYFEFTVSGARSGDVGDWTLTGWFDEYGETVPAATALMENYPNPFNASTSISYHLSSSGAVKLEVYNLMGQKVAVLAEGAQEAGRHSVTWDAADYTSGIYFYKLTVDGDIFTKRMTLLK